MRRAESGSTPRDTVAGGPLSPGFAIGCRACGAPSEPGAERCSYCGGDQPHDAATRARLVAHRARMRRALQQLRAVLGTQLRETLSRRWMALFLFAYFVVPLLTTTLGVGVPLGALFLAAAVLELPRIPDFFGMLAFAIAIFGGGGIGLAVGLAVPYNMLKRHASGVRRRAFEVMSSLDATSEVRCPRCGGLARVVALETEESAPCPWCAGALLPTASMASVREALVRALAEHDPQLAERVVSNLGRSDARTRLQPRVPGYELRGGGAVAAGSTAGVPLAAFNEIVDGSFVLRVEAAVATRLEGELWLVRPEAEAALRGLAREWGYALPEQAAASPSAGWRAYGEPVAAPLGPLGETLARLNGDTGLLLDPAGLSLWRRASGLTRSWGLLEEHHATVAELARELRSRDP